MLPSLPPKPSRPTGPAGGRTTSGGSGCCTTPGTRGCTGPSTPGAGARAEHLIYLEEETEKAGAPYVGADLMPDCCTPGRPSPSRRNPVQRARWLPPVLRGEEVWCQGFSEPDAGLRPRGTAHPRVAGRRRLRSERVKIWTSHAEVADWCELLVRTDPAAPKHRGISWLAMPMEHPGTPSGHCAPWRAEPSSRGGLPGRGAGAVAHRVGAERRLARDHGDPVVQRGTAFVGEVVAYRAGVGEVAREARKNGRWDDPALRRRLGGLNAEFRALWRLTRWNVSEAQSDGGVPGVGGSVFKLRYSHARQELYDAAAEVLGPEALDLGREWTLKEHG